MALTISDRIKETTTTTGTGTYNLGGAVTGFETFTANLSNSDTTYYCCTDNTDFEVGLGTFASSGTTLARTTILASSNSNNAVSWSSGTRTIFCTLPSAKTIVLDASGNASVGGTITATGTSVFTNLDISGDVDVDGTLEADAVTVNGTALNTVIAGVTVTNATNSAHVSVADNESTNEENLIPFIEDTSATGNVGLESDGDFAYNPSTGTVSATIFKGNIDAVDGDFDGTLEADAITVGGTALNTVIAGVTVTNATNSAHVSVADNESTDEENLITFIEDASATGNVGLESDGDFSYNPSSGTVTATIFKGNIDAVDGDFDGTLEADAITVGGTALNTVIAGVTVTNATNSAHVLVTDNESTNEENLIAFVEDATSSTGNVGLEMDGHLTYNPSSGTVTATVFKGNIDAVDGDFDGTLEADAITLNGTAITATATLSTGISNNNVPKFTSGVADDDFLRVAGTAIEGRSASEVLSDIGATTADLAANEATALAIALG
jgi:cytoskeletal protein CcmA (bactofilin family)|tara:strand:- start:377 stop:1870 length:1494 start_codon:yes stop_codon:yes gene_type:complete